MLEIREGKGYLSSLLDTLYTKVQKSPGQFSWLFLGWIRKSKNINLTVYIYESEQNFEEVIDEDQIEKR